MHIQEFVNTDLEYDLTNISSNSKEIKPDGIFFALKGVSTDGNRYLSEAIQNGAKLIYTSEDTKLDNNNIFIQKVSDINKEFNDISSKFYGYPSKKLNIIATTGTNGKSTTSWIIKDFIDRVRKSGYIGTIGIKYDDELKPSPYTTPLPNQYNQFFYNMVKNGIEDVAIEVSSHGLSQHRVDFMEIQCAVMTNITHEHLDYHKTMESYLKSKAKLFEKISKDGYSILNIDDSSYDYLKKITKSKILTYGKDKNADLKISNIKLFDDKTEFSLSYMGDTYEVTSNLLAEFNVYNLCAAYGALIVNRFKLSDLIKYSKDITQVVGRVEKIKNSDNMIIVDYAHTPDGFEKIFEYVNSIKHNRIISVFGAAGKRDKSKRSILGEIASKYSDNIILTEEDQVDEDPKEIAYEIQKGIVNVSNRFIADRETAIKYAYSILNKDDILVVLGKGYDFYMHRLNGREPYKSDKKIIDDLVGGFYE